MNLSMRHFQIQKGFTLIEAMISLVILSIGLLGVAAMQSMGLKHNYDAFQRTQATNLAYDIVENMRLDPVNALKTSATNPYAATYYSAVSPGATCDNLSVLPTDIKQCWEVALRDRLPAGIITITAPPSIDDPTLTLIISWSDSWIETGQTSAGTSFQTFTFQIRS